MTDVPDGLLSAASMWYAKVRVPATFDACHPRVVRVALQLAEGDVRRLVIDGADVIVHARPMWR